MSDILLATSFFLKNDVKQIEKMRPYAPLGTLSVAASLRNLSYSVAVFDAMLSDGEQEFEACLDKGRPRIVALYEDQFNFLNKMCLTHSRDAAFRMSEAARAAGATVLAAGAAVSDDPGPYLENGVDYALIGEADETLSELVEILTGRSRRSPKSVPGLAMRDPRFQECRVPNRASVAAEERRCVPDARLGSVRGGALPQSLDRRSRILQRKHGDQPGVHRFAATGVRNRSGGNTTRRDRRLGWQRSWPT